MTVGSSPLGSSPGTLPGNRERAGTDPVVRLVGLRKSFNRHEVLRGLSIDFPRGGTTVVLGPSGCGKSVMLKHVIGLLRPDAGEVWFDGRRIDGVSEQDFGPIRRQFGFLFQLGALFDSMTVGDNVAFPLVEHTRQSPEARRERVREVLRMVDLEDVEGKMPAELSGGQRKRVALARAIVLEPEVVLYDEPTTGLDPILSDVIAGLIRRLQQRLRLTSIVVTHDLPLAFRVADRMVILYDGRVLAEGTPEQVRASPDAYVQAFLKGESSGAALDEAGGVRLERE